MRRRRETAAAATFVAGAPPPRRQRAGRALPVTCAPLGRRSAARALRRSSAAASTASPLGSARRDTTVRRARPRRLPARLIPTTGVSSETCAPRASGESRSAAETTRCLLHHPKTSPIHPLQFLPAPSNRLHRCGAGSASPTACANGTFNPSLGAVSVTQCLACQEGFFCNSTGLTVPLFPCTAGFYCPNGTVYPTLPCTTGHFCPGGTVTPQPCWAGSYQALPGQASCDECPPMYYCPQNTATPIDCPAGSVCPSGTQAATQFLCPIGTFSNATKLSDASQCTRCTAGSFCATAGLTAPTGACDAGYYCLGGAFVATPADGFDLGYTCSVGTGIWNASAVPATGDVCPLGHTCVAGSVAPTPCRPGTYLNTSRATSPAACQPCVPGFMCPDYATVTPYVPCPLGYACSGGNINGTETPCALGHACPGGVSTGIACDPGSYADVVGLTSCKMCPSGSYCQLGQILPITCPAGHFCGNGTGATPTACPIGTATNTTGLGDVNECAPCAGGFFCDTPGLVAPSGRCAAGSVCVSGAPVANPTDNVTGYVCPAAAFCPLGSASPTWCSPGTFSNTTGNTQPSDCFACTPGFTCPDVGTVIPTLLCDAGYYCPGHDAHATLNCTLGSFCPEGSFAPTPCAAGSFQQLPGQASCDVCPPSYYCPPNGTVVPLACPPGYYCEAGTRLATQTPCPPGTFGNVSMLGAVSDCAVCSPGSFCGSPGLTAPTGACDAGFYCLGGSNVSAPVDTFLGGYVCSVGATGYDPSVPSIGDACPLGHYCPLGSSAPTPCGPGTFNNATRATNASACLACLPSFACPAPGTALPELPCPERYFCAGGNVGQEAPCPRGSYCAGGNAGPVPCPPGTYSALPAAASCDPCPGGAYCVLGTYAPAACPPGYACPLVPGDGVGTTSAYAFPCPPGTYSPFFNLTSTAQCLPCVAGSWCGTPGLAAPTGLCDPGYVCFAGSALPSPSLGDNVNGTECQPGERAWEWGGVMESTDECKSTEAASRVRGRVGVGCCERGDRRVQVDESRCCEAFRAHT